jgi:hypothetical protein
MDQPALRNEWNSLTSYKKGQILDNFYTAISQKIAGRSTSPAAPAPKPNIPVATGGRNANGTPPADDFGLALQSAMNNFKRK